MSHSLIIWIVAVLPPITAQGMPKDVVRKASRAAAIGTHSVEGLDEELKIVRRKRRNY